jgi:hypothetical protein
VAEVLRSGFAKFVAGGRATFRPNLVALALLTSGLFIQTVSAQAPAAQPKKAPQANSAQPADTPTPPPAQIWLPPLQNPEHAPLIEWDGKLLTIDAENSSLSDIMLGIRSHTGASIDMPASANRERIAVHLGPAPIREVLSSLLYGTDFNYVIQSSEDDDSALGKVILIPRDADSSQGQDTVADDGLPKPKMRLMPGYAAPGKRDFEVAHARATEDNSSPVADTPVADTPTADASANPDQPAGTPVDAAANASTDPQPSTSESADSSSPSDANNTLTASGQSLSSATQPIAAGGSSSAGGTPTTIGAMEQNLQNMYKQRQQLQAQQNRPTPPPTNAQ